MRSRETKVSAWTRFSIRGLIVVIVAVALGFAIRSYVDPLFRYRLTGSQSALVDAVRSRLADGMEEAKVIDLLGEPTEAPSWAYIAMVRKVAPLNESSFPDGFRDTDKFLSFARDRKTRNLNVVTLQFRDDKLINFAPGWQESGDDVIDRLE
jgi:hypothetical protein